MESLTCYISSLDANAEQVLSAVRGHWCIATHLHWSLHVAFRECDSELCKRNGADLEQGGTKTALLKLLTGYMQLPCVRRC